MVPNFIFRQLFLVTCLLVVSVYSTNVPKNNLRCGGVLTAISGIISYKPFDSTEYNERCVWIVQAPNATWYEVTTRLLGLQSSVLITGLGSNSNLNNTIAKILPNEEPQQIAFSNLLVITFQTTSGGPLYKGFSLEYLAYTGGELGAPLTNPVSSATVVSAEEGTLGHPKNEWSYGNNELSTFIFPPLNNFYNQTGTTDITYYRAGIQDSCYDHLTVYMYDTSVTVQNRWIKIRKICGVVETESMSHRDFILIVFETDASIVSSGFQLAYSKGRE